MLTLDKIFLPIMPVNCKYCVDDFAKKRVGISIRPVSSNRVYDTVSNHAHAYMGSIIVMGEEM